MSEATPKPGPIEPVGINHIVLNVSDLERSHRFWTEVIGFRQVGTITPDSPVGMSMRFYSGSASNHHDVALAEVADAESGDADAPALAASRVGLNHVAIRYADRDTWLAALRHVQECGVEFGMRMQHGTTHSLYINDPDGHGVELLYELPRERWQGDLNAALNYVKFQPTKGEEALQDDLETPTFQTP